MITILVTGPRACGQLCTLGFSQFQLAGKWVWVQLAQQTEAWLLLHSLDSVSWYSLVMGQAAPRGKPTQAGEPHPDDTAVWPLAASETCIFAWESRQMVMNIGLGLCAIPIQTGVSNITPKAVNWWLVCGNGRGRPVITHLKACNCQ